MQHVGAGVVLADHLTAPRINASVDLLICLNRAIDHLTAVGPNSGDGKLGVIDPHGA